jgi:hypothetical protein
MIAPIPQYFACFSIGSAMFNPLFPLTSESVACDSRGKARLGLVWGHFAR